MHKREVLSICSHNSARSQMAQGWLNHLAGDLRMVRATLREKIAARPEAGF